MTTYKGLKRDTTKSGVPRIRHRATGLTLHGAEGSEQFEREYQAAEAIARGEGPQSVGRVAKRTLRPGEPSNASTLDWLVERYEESPKFLDELHPDTQRARHNVLAALCASMWRGKRRGSLPFAPMDAQDIETLRDEKRENPEAGNARIKSLRALFAWARDKPRCYVATNPCDGVKKLKPKNRDGFYTATGEDVAILEAHFPPGSTARRAFALLQCFGTRRADVVRLGPHMERLGKYDDGSPRRYLYVAPGKGAQSVHRDPSEPLEMDLTPELIAALAVPPPAPTGENVVSLHKRPKTSTYIVNEHGKPFSKAGFGNRLRDWCNQAARAYATAHCIEDWRSLGVAKVTAHSFRKELAGVMLANGADAGALMAQFGWGTLKTAQTYIDKFDRKRAARRAGQFVRRVNG